jgi:hypothetical protein
MNLIVTLPPKAEQEALVDSWVEAIIKQTEITEFNKLVKQCLKAGLSIHGITCLLLHQSTVDATLKRIKHEESITLEAAFGRPICMN